MGCVVHQQLEYVEVDFIEGHFSMRFSEGILSLSDGSRVHTIIHFFIYTRKSNNNHG